MKIEPGDKVNPEATVTVEPAGEAIADLTGRDMLAWLTAHPEHLDLPVMLLPMVGDGDAVVATEIDHDAFNPDTGKWWIVLSAERKVSDDE